jgi:hypothetical protein
MGELKTKYGAEISNEAMVEYFEMLINKIFKLLPLHEECCMTLDTYLFSLLCELAGGNKLLFEDKYFIQLLNNLENLQDIKCEYKKYRSQIFKCISICKDIIDNLKEGVETNDI